MVIKIRIITTSLCLDLSLLFFHTVLFSIAYPDLVGMDVLSQKQPRDSSPLPLPPAPPGGSQTVPVPE